MSHTESTRKRRGVIRLGPIPLGEDTEEEVGCTDSEILPGEWEVQPTSHIRHLNLGVHHREDRTLELVWKPVGWNRRTVRNLHSTCEECAHACLLPKQGGGRILKLLRIVISFLLPQQYMSQKTLDAHSSSLCYTNSVIDTDILSILLTAQVAF